MTAKKKKKKKKKSHLSEKVITKSTYTEHLICCKYCTTNFTLWCWKNSDFGVQTNLRLKPPKLTSCMTLTSQS